MCHRPNLILPSTWMAFKGPPWQTLLQLMEQEKGTRQRHSGLSQAGLLLLSTYTDCPCGRRQNMSSLMVRTALIFGFLLYLVAYFSCPTYALSPQVMQADLQDWGHIHSVIANIACWSILFNLLCTSIDTWNTTSPCEALAFLEYQISRIAWMSAAAWE